MEDMDRYGDYNELDEVPGGKKNIVLTILKIIICTVCFAVFGLIIFRVILFNYYPDNIKNIYFNDELTALYNSNDGDIGAVTQKPRAPYDDPDKGNFFAGNLIVIEEAGQLQVSVRYNSSVFETLEKMYGIDLDEKDESLFSFSLERVPFNEDEKPYEIGRLDYSERDSAMMYTYYKLVFDDVEFLDSDSYDWIRLVININGVEGAEPHYILIYERSEEYDMFKEYKLSGKEKP